MKELIPKDWYKVLEGEFDKSYFVDLEAFVAQQYMESQCFPPFHQLFHALEACSLNHTKVVILGQDPYHGKGQANGLAFSVNDQVQLPPSLRNIFKELKTDINLSTPNSGNLERWSRQGVLLLNNVLSVREGEADSHKGRGWEVFTDAIVQVLSKERENLIFILWGAKAQKKASIIDTSKHFILTSGHPSPLSAYRGFFGCKHFSKTNEILTQLGLPNIQW